MAVLTKIAILLGLFFKALLPELLNRMKQARKVDPIGGGEETKDAVNDDIEKQIENKP